MIGHPTPYLDARARVDGSLPYIVNLSLPGMLHAKILRSPHPHARITRIDATAAAQAPGVAAVLTGRELAEAGDIHFLYGIGIPDQPILAFDRVRFVGEPVAVVAAETCEQAEAALDLVRIDYEPLPAVDNELDAIAPGAPLLHKDAANNIVTHYRLRHGDVDAAFAASDHVVEETYTSPAAQQVTLERHVALAQFENNRLTVHTASQSPYGVRRVLAEIFNLKPEQVRVLSGPLGGGYGAKAHIRLEPIVAALARKTAGRPVKLVATRAEEFVIVTKHAATTRIKSGMMRDGTLTAREVTSWWNTGAYADAGFMLTKGGLLRSIGPYRIPAVRADAYGVYTNRPPAAFRGAMAPQTAWAYESHMDTLAHTLGMDPLELRRKNLLREGDGWATGETMHAVHYRECLDEVVRLLEQDSPRAGRRSTPARPRSRRHDEKPPVPLPLRGAHCAGRRRRRHPLHQFRGNGAGGTHDSGAARGRPLAAAARRRARGRAGYTRDTVRPDHQRQPHHAHDGERRPARGGRGRRPIARARRTWHCRISPSTKPWYNPEVRMEIDLLVQTHCKRLRLPTLARNYAKFAQEAAQANQPYHQYLLALLEQEVLQREANQERRRLQAAKFPVLRTLDSFDFSMVPSVNKAKILELARGDYLAQCENILLVGEIGTGKTHLATALGVAAAGKASECAFTRRPTWFMSSPKHGMNGVCCACKRSS